MKDLLFIITSRGVGGLEKRFATLYEYYSLKNSTEYKITFLVSRAQANLLDNYKGRLINDNLKLIKFGLPSVRLRHNRLIERALRYTDYALLILTLVFRLPVRKGYCAHFVTSSSLYFRHLIRSKTKVFSFVHSHNAEKRVNSPGFRKIVFENFKIDCLSSAIRDQIRSLIKIDRSNLYISPCSFVDYSKTSIGIKKKRITFVGRFVPGKGLSLLLPVLPIICQKHKNIEIFILGHGVKQKCMERFINKENLAEYITLGFCKSPTNILKESLIYLSLQEKENYPSQALIEAMACGNAIIATNVGLTNKIVSNDTGLLIERSIEQLSDAIDYLLTNKHKSIEFGKNARNKVMKEHRVDRFSNYLLHELYP